jgi:hypothetical protein
MRRFLAFLHLVRPMLYLALLFAALSSPYWYEALVHLSDERRAHAAVRIGMTAHQVLDAVGKPPGDYGPAGATYATPGYD